VANIDIVAHIQAALERLRDAPSLLRQRDEYSLRLGFYAIREHVLVCDLVDEDVYVLAVRHCAMDLARGTAELEPSLVEEVEMLHQRVVASAG
jgi:plasmid stabilization system protein ParE